MWMGSIYSKGRVTLLLTIQNKKIKIVKYLKFLFKISKYQNFNI